MKTAFLRRPGLPDLAYNRFLPRKPALPGVMFLGGFRSDRNGTKAKFLEQSCRRRGQPYVRFDYSGHGESGGRFDEGTIESWRDDALAIFDTLCKGPTVLVGSSMGGWLGLLLALQRPDRVCGFVGVAAAPDFTKEMAEKRFTAAMHEAMARDGYAEVPNDYSPEPYKITRGLIESGGRVCLLNHRHHLPVPVYLLQGKKDTEVDWHMPERIASCLDGADVHSSPPAAALPGKIRARPRHNALE
ncbi:MAG: alpha/beta hydrolase [Micavibrio aeruginosavorus]|nr:alpha/beta hydrolase [Micavibrio aeruginosavorus]